LIFIKKYDRINQIKHNKGVIMVKKIEKDYELMKDNVDKLLKKISKLVDKFDDKYETDLTNDLDYKLDEVADLIVDNYVNEDA
jgi:hypothetical protein